MQSGLALTHDMMLVLGLIGFTIAMFMFERIRADAAVAGGAGHARLYRHRLRAGTVPRLFRQRRDQRHRNDDPRRRPRPHRRAEPPRRLAAAPLERRRTAADTGQFRGRRRNVRLHAEPRRHRAVPAGRCAPVGPHRPDPGAAAVSDRGCHHYGRAADHGRQFAPDDAQRPAALRQPEPAVRRSHAESAADVHAAADRPAAAGSRPAVFPVPEISLVQ